MEVKEAKLIIESQIGFGIWENEEYDVYEIAYDYDELIKWCKDSMDLNCGEIVNNEEIEIDNIKISYYGTDSDECIAPWICKKHDGTVFAFGYTSD